MQTKPQIVNIWKFNAATGYWQLVRDCYRENAARWLEIFQGDEPDTVFKAQRTRPTKAPEA